MKSAGNVASGKSLQVIVLHGWQKLNNVAFRSHRKPIKGYPTLTPCGFFSNKDFYRGNCEGLSF